MTSEPIAAAVQDFIARHISSVEQMEILCALNRDWDRLWSVAEVYKLIQSSEKSVAESLNKFCDSGVLAQAEQGLFRLKPRTEELAAAVKATVHAYQQKRVKVIELIYQKPPDAITEFADAFRLRKKS